MDDLMVDKSIERLQFEFEERPVPVKILKDADGVLERELALTLKKGQEKNLPLWIATELVKQGYAKLKENFIELSELHDVLKKEGEAHALQPIDEDFYLKVREQLRFLREIDSPTAQQSFERIEALLRDIISMRLFKILKIASQAKNARSFAESMTKEERVLFQELSSACTQWRDKLFTLE
ncbi:MAG: hypothetical protein ACFFCD_00730 [Promethearchaeota archaeon]